MLESVGIKGKECLLRTACEIFEAPLGNFGFLGEILGLVFSAGRSAYATSHLKEYAQAEERGRTTSDCSYYYDMCIHSLFTNVTKEPKIIPVSEESRQKRFIYLTPERRLTFPPGTILILIPLLSVPIRTVPASGVALTAFQGQVTFQVFLDDLGLTTEEHPFGVLPFLDELSPDDLPRRKRESITRRSDPKLPGGDRGMLYQIVEDTLRNSGLIGKACLLRAICEMFQYPLDNHGFLGEVLELFFSVSLTPDADNRLPEYAAAERAGRTTGKCSAYLKACPYSFFTNPLDEENIDKEENSKKSPYEAHHRSGGIFSPSNMFAVLFEYFESWL